jgi:hypothetical protein
MIRIPDFVLEHLVKNNYIGKTKTLIIGENYPSPNYITSYFYRSILVHPVLPYGANHFLSYLCDGLLIPTVNTKGNALTEIERLNIFLESGFLVIDAQENNIKPINPAILSISDIDLLIKTIILINPTNIIFITKNNQNVIDSLKTHTLFNLIDNKIVYNLLKKRYWFSYPAPPANHKLFKNEINDVRTMLYL